MTVLENVGLCDNGYIEVKETTVAQKIRLRTPSYGTISAKYQEFLGLQTEDKIDEPVPTKENNDGTTAKSDAEIVAVVALNPRIADIVTLLQINGRIKSDGFKALKIKPTMHLNMEKNARYETVQDEVAEDIMTDSEPTIQDEIESPSAELTEPVDKEESKISKNGTVAAKIEKFATTLEQKNETLVSPIVVEEQSARPVSREVPLVAPERKLADSDALEKKDTILSTEDTQSEQLNDNSIVEDSVDNVTLPNTIEDLAAIKEYLEKTARLKMEVEKAKEEEDAAKIEAEKAEHEAAARRDEFRKTAERIAAHQEELIAQKEKSKEQATMYDTQRGKYENESAEYQKAINDMLAIIGDSKEDNKGKIM